MREHSKPGPAPPQAPTPVLDTALAHARRGVPVLPVATNKQPLTGRGVYDATTDPQRISHYYRRHPEAGVAIRTGLASGLVELDLDTYPAMQRAMEALGSAPSLVTLTGRGFRLRFSAPEQALRSFVPWPGAELISEGRYVVVPPSLHPSGMSYSYLAHGSANGAPGNSPAVALGPPARDLPPLPKWIVRLGHQEPAAGHSPYPVDTDAATGAPIPEGERNRTLFRIGCSLRGAGADHGSILAHLHEANRLRCTTPLPGAEVDKIARSVTSRYEPGKKP